jgi:hypothetical protein
VNRREFTYQLVQLNDALEPVRSACGCVVRYKHRLFLLTVAHAGKKGDWAISLKYVPGQGMQQQPLGALHFLMRLRLFRTFIKGRNLDFAYKPLDSAPPAVLQELTPTGVILREEPKAIIETDFSMLPNPTAQYGFWGTAWDAYEPNRFWLAPREELNLALADSRGDFLFFKRSSPYRSFTDYRGCSGSPITDDAGSPHVVRDLYGVIHHSRAAFGIIVSRGGFTKGAIEFARDKPMFLLYTSDLIAMQEGRDVLAEGFTRTDA